MKWIAKKTVAKKLYNEETMLNLSVFSHNHRPSGVNLLAKNNQTWIFGTIIMF
jgi:hypothetical protein